MDQPAPPSTEVVELALPAQPEVVSVARLVAGALVAADPAFDEERGADVRLAVSEACTNAVQAQQRRAEQDPVAAEGESVLLRCAWSTGHLELTVTDHGRGFDPDAVRAHPEVTDPDRLNHEGGLGIPLIRLLSDHVEFHAGPEGTTVTMTFEPRPDGTNNLIEGLRV